MGDINKSLQWMYDRVGKVGYSMNNRTGPNSYDCSSAVCYALKSGGFMDFNYPTNTDGLYKLENKLLKPISRSQASDGSLFISGQKGNSGGSGGHTGFLRRRNGILQAVHCTYSYGNNNIAITQAAGWMGEATRPVHFYDVIGAVEIDGEGEKQRVKLTVDGSWGPATTRRLQEYFNTPIKDGVISGQIKCKANQDIPSVEFGKGGSMVIRAIQKWLGLTQDGNFGPATCKALQKKMGTIQDGYISVPSDCVKVMQSRLNENKL